MRIFEKASLLVGVCLMSLSFWIVFNKRNSGGESRSAETPVPFQTAESESAAESVVIEQSKALGAAKADREARIAADPDAYWDPGRSGREYRAKVMRHKQISQFLTSSRREDPAYREVMIKLLENGYGLGEWIDFVGLASQFHMPVSLARARLEAEGFLPDEIEEGLVPARAHQEIMEKHIATTCRMVMGIQDTAFIDELLEIELPYAQGDQVLGVGPLAMIRGDRLHTDEDWLDDEFRSAMERYSGPERPRRDMSEPVEFEPSGDEGVLAPTNFTLPTDGE